MTTLSFLTTPNIAMHYTHRFLVMHSITPSTIAGIRLAGAHSVAVYDLLRLWCLQGWRVHTESTAVMNGGWMLNQG